MPTPHITRRVLNRRAYSPADEGNLVAWFQRGRGATAAQWDDQTGLGRHYAQATGASQPTLNADGTFTFDGTNHFFKTAGFTLPQPATSYRLFKLKTWTSGRYVCDGNALNSAASACATATPQLNMYAGTSGVANNSIQLDTWVVGVWVWNGASSSFRISGGATNTGDAGSTALGGLTLGATAAGGSKSNIQVADELHYSAAHSTATQDRVVAYLLNRGVAVLSPGRLIADGTSLTVGQGSTSPSTDNYAAQFLAAQPAGRWVLSNLGVGGQALAAMTSDIATQVATVKDQFSRPLLISGEGCTNDLFAGTSAAATFALYQAYREAAMNGAGSNAVFARWTVGPRSDTGVAAGFETARGTLNGLIRNNWPWSQDLLVDVAANTTIGDAGDELDTTYYNADKVHMTTAGYGIRKDVFTTATSAAGLL